MDFWTVIADVSGVVTIATAAWQIAQFAFKKTRIVQRAYARRFFKKPATLVSSETIRLAALLHDLGHLAGSYARQTQIAMIPGNHNIDVLLAPHHGSKKA